MNIIYIDKLSFFSLLSVICSRINYSYIFYFDIFSSGKFFAEILVKLGLLKVIPRLAEFRLADIRDEKGECQFFRITDDLKNICFEISDKKFATNDFLKRFANHFDFRKVLFFFEKTLCEEIKEVVVFINVAKWHAKNVASYNGEKIIFFLEKNLWSDFLSQYSIRFNITPYQYRTIINSSYFGYFNQARNFIIGRAKSKLNIFARNKNDSKRETLQTIADRKYPMVSAWYTGKTVTFDLKKRSDFFWLLKSDMPRNQVLVYFDRKDIPATEETANILNREGVKYLALSCGARTSGDIPVWNPTTTYRKLKKSFILALLKTYLLNFTRLKNIPIFFVINMLYFAIQYAYWRDFFSSNDIKININPADFFKSNIPMVLALNENGGVNISYQWSNLNFSSILISNCSDVMFSFGPAYKWVWEANHSAIDNLIYCGYITDYSFKEASEDSMKIRKQLFGRGVKFIICYFDENSMDDRMAVITHERSARIYKYLIEKMLEDETLGLIFKPVFPKTLYQRISSISKLIEKAKASGRCIFMDRGSYVTEQYPTEAAQAADVCVGFLLSGTVALESYLSGTPTVFLDVEKLYSNPIYQWGKGKAVFDDIDYLFSAIQKYRHNPNSIPGFGDLSPWVKDKDRFKDGNASLRIGQYINWLLEMFNQGKTRKEAIRYANQKYAELWGRENVIKWR